MIPLAQYLNDMQGEEFVPLRAVNANSARPLEHRVEAVTIRPLKPQPTRLVPLAPTAGEGAAREELAAAKGRWDAERSALEEALRTAREDAQRLAAEGEAGLSAALDAQREELAAEKAEALAAARESWTSEQADRLADLMILQMAVFEDAMRASVRGVLKPLAMDARQRRALDDLADAVKLVAPEGTDYRIAATGPSDLLTKFREKLGDRGQRVAVRPDESRLDIRVEADQTLIETRLSAWGKALEQALS